MHRTLMWGIRGFDVELYGQVLTTHSCTALTSFSPTGNSLPPESSMSDMDYRLSLIKIAKHNPYTQ